LLKAEGSLTLVKRLFAPATKKTFPEEYHSDTLRSKSNLATEYGYQGRWEDAEELDLEIIEARSRVLGLDHPDTFETKAHLAVIRLYQGRSEEAESLSVQPSIVI
jgi:hypothetical protein